MHVAVVVGQLSGFFLDGGVANNHKTPELNADPTLMQMMISRTSCEVFFMHSGGISLATFTRNLGLQCR